MFTGLVEERGTVSQITLSGDTARLSIHCPTIASDAKRGDSISVCGCCLTAVQIDQTVICFDVGDETLRRTSLGTLSAGSQVNLERALRAGDRLGGHYVTGHIDAVIRILSRTDSDEWSTVWFELPNRLAGQVAEKGSVTIDGVSLTVVAVEADRFSVMLVPHTLGVTTLGSRQSGEGVNFETDILAKYIQRQMDLTGSQPAGQLNDLDR